MSTSTTDDQDLFVSLLERALRIGATTEEHASKFRGLAEGDLQFATDLVKQNLKNFENRHAQLWSMEATYGKTQSNFGQPPLRFNSKLKPSVGGNIRGYTLIKESGEKEKRTIKIPEAQSINDGDSQWVNVKNITIPVEYFDETNIHSTLGKASFPQQTQREFVYANEFDVQYFCRTMIEDALRSLGLGEYVESHLEISLYGMRPDIVVVLKFEGRVFFAVVVKVPPKKGDEADLFKNLNLGGQIWSYLYAMKVTGIENPIGAIMTYNSIAIVTLQDFSSDKKHMSRVGMTQQKMSTGKAPKYDLPAQEETCVNRTRFTEINIEHDEQMTQELFEPEIMTRDVYYSTVHHAGEVFPCLLQAIDIAYQGVVEAPKERILVLEEGNNIGRRLVFEMGESSFNWVKTPLYIGTPTNPKPFCAQVDSKVLPKKGTVHLYVLGKLGDGGKASVYLACSTGGRVCAIKDYYLKPSTRSTDKERVDEEDARREILHNKAADEAKKWGVVYKGHYKARVQYLGGKPCLLMPYGYEITDDADDRWKLVPAIRDKVVQFARTKPSYVYQNSDLCWRHVLLDSSGRIFLCDLESLEEIDGEFDMDKVVYEQLESLLKPIIDDEKVAKTQVWVEDSATEEELVSLICKKEHLHAFFKSFASSEDGTVDEKHFRKIVQSLFRTRAKPAPAEDKVTVSLYMIDHYRDDQTNNQDMEFEDSPQDSVPDLERSEDSPRKRTKIGT